MFCSCCTAVVVCRQTIMTSSFASPQLNATFNKNTSSHAGKFRLVATPTGVLSQVVPQVREAGAPSGTLSRGKGGGWRGKGGWRAGGVPEGGRGLDGGWRSEGKG
jgi:hypothetical protein